MKRKTKLWLKKRALMLLSAIVWRVDEWIHKQQLALREELSGAVPVAPMSARHSDVGSTPTPRSKRESFQQWEARRSGIAVMSKKEAHRQRAISASEFDLRFAR